MRFIYDWHFTFIEDRSYSNLNPMLLMYLLKTGANMMRHKKRQLPFVREKNWKYVQNYVFFFLKFNYPFDWFVCLYFSRSFALNFIRTNRIILIEPWWKTHFVKQNEWVYWTFDLILYTIALDKNLLKMICAWINSINYNKTRLIIIFNDVNNFRPTNFHFELHSLKWNGQQQAHVRYCFFSRSLEFVT